jgi:hypothetical protein
MIPRLIAFCCSLLPIVCAGCTTFVSGPASLTDPVPVYFVRYNVHSSVLMPVDGKYVDYSFGDWRYAAELHKLPNDALGALLVSFDSTLERRYLAIDPRMGQPFIPDNPDLVIRLFASRELVRQRIAELEQRVGRDLKLHEKDGMVVHYGPDVTFVKDPEHYGLTNNCNHLTAATLRAIGFQVEGSAENNNFHFTQLRGPEDAPATPGPDAQRTTVDFPAPGAKPGSR